MERQAFIITSLGELVKPLSVKVDESNPKVIVARAMYAKCETGKPKERKFYYRHTPDLYISKNRDCTHDMLYFVTTPEEFAELIHKAEERALLTAAREEKVLEKAQKRHDYYAAQILVAADSTAKLVDCVADEFNKNK